MAGIFGCIARSKCEFKVVRRLSRASRRRGTGATAAIIEKDGRYSVAASVRLKRLADASTFLAITTDPLSTPMDDLFFVEKGGAAVCERVVFDRPTSGTESVVDAVSPAGLAKVLNAASQRDAVRFAKAVLSTERGAAAYAVVLPKLGCLLLFSNTGNLHYAATSSQVAFASERNTLEHAGMGEIKQVFDPEVFEILTSDEGITMEVEQGKQRSDSAPILLPNDDNILVDREPDLVRCSRCILPETMPFIDFDSNGVCNYCRNYQRRNQPRPMKELEALAARHKRADRPDIIVPFSGGRDSCFALHVAKEELGMRPVAYMYDWGLVTDVGRRNASRVTAALGVETIVVSANFSKKRANVRKNLAAWLGNPALSMLGILTAGDKHFFRYIESMQRETGISLNLWGINPLEVTHFKAGFLGLEPDFEEARVYTSEWRRQLRYQKLRAREMLRQPKYLNASLWDTLSGEYHRSFATKIDYHHLFDYRKWDEEEVNQVLFDRYLWEPADDTPTTWRIGDGTAAFTNYVYNTVAGFTEHDTFRSNQVREGDLSRERALRMVREENRPRYNAIKWYLDVVGVDFKTAIRAVNAMRRLH